MPDKRKSQDVSAAMRRMAELAKMGFAPAEIERVVAKARSVLEYVEQLNEVDTDGVEPTSHAVDVGSNLRDDVAKPSGIESRIIEAAPEKDGPYVQVPKVIESE